MVELVFPITREFLLSAMKLPADDEYGEAVGYLADAMNSFYRFGKNNEYSGLYGEKELRKLLKKTCRKNCTLFSPRRKEISELMNKCTDLFVNAYRKGCMDRRKGA